MIFTGLNFGQILQILNKELIIKFGYQKRNIREIIAAKSAELLIEHVFMKALLHFYNFYT